ncbi:MAG: DUF2130 domain-containing protein [Firmicutes bacterium]|nr:DUF2130 domain-containing protein [Bacillota bacterium]
MSGTVIVCPNCKNPFEITDAIQRQIEDELTKAKAGQEENLRREFLSRAEENEKQAVLSAVREAEQAAEQKLLRERQNAKLELERTKQATELALENAKQSTELENEKLRREAKNAQDSADRLREQQKGLLEELSKAAEAKKDAELAARKELLSKEKLIREEAVRAASEDFYTQIREQQETISKLREQLTAAKQVAEQGSQQAQGEILELDLEQSLRAHFPYDSVREVKKGEQGSDVRQTVNEQFYQNCGLIVWECKNAKAYSPKWLEKLKDVMAEEKAQIGVLVFRPTDGGGEDFKQIEGNIWMVKPRYAVMLASLLREVCVRVFVANRNASGKDVKIEMMYNYLTGGEFASRIRSVIESYDEMARQLALEKKQAQKRWAAQEKIIEKVSKSLCGMSGDLEGIAGREILALPAMEDEAGENEANEANEELGIRSEELRREGMAGEQRIDTVGTGDGGPARASAPMGVSGQWPVASGQLKEDELIPRIPNPEESGQWSVVGGQLKEDNLIPRIPNPESRAPNSEPRTHNPAIQGDDDDAY